MKFFSTRKSINRLAWGFKNYCQAFRSPLSVRQKHWLTGWLQCEKRIEIGGLVKLVSRLRVCLSVERGTVGNLVGLESLKLVDHNEWGSDQSKTWKSRGRDLNFSRRDDPCDWSLWLVDFLISSLVKFLELAGWLNIDFGRFSLQAMKMVSLPRREHKAKRGMSEIAHNHFAQVPSELSLSLILIAYDFMHC